MTEIQTKAQELGILLTKDIVETAIDCTGEFQFTELQDCVENFCNKYNIKKEDIIIDYENYGDGDIALIIKSTINKTEEELAKEIETRLKQINKEKTKKIKELDGLKKRIAKLEKEIGQTK